MTRKALLVMAKRPFPGRTKTRLTPHLSLTEASDLYAAFLQDVLALAQSIPGVTPFVAYAPADEDTAAYFRQLAPHMELVPQTGETLGDRLAYVLGSCLEAGYDQVAAMNSDSPTMPADYLAQAFAQLDEPQTDVVLGPCDDGGYYLIGWKQPHPRLVREVQMSTPQVFQETLAIAAQEQLHVGQLPTWYDVDNVTDLVRIQADLARDEQIAPHTRVALSGWELEPR